MYLEITYDKGDVSNHKQYKYLECPKWIILWERQILWAPPPWIGKLDASHSSVKIMFSKKVTKQNVCVNICRQYYFSNYISLSGLPSLFLRLTQNYEQTPRSSLRLVLLEIIVCFFSSLSCFCQFSSMVFPVFTQFYLFRVDTKPQNLCKLWCISFSGCFRNNLLEINFGEGIYSTVSWHYTEGNWTVSIPCS